MAQTVPMDSLHFQLNVHYLCVYMSLFRAEHCGEIYEWTRKNIYAKSDGIYKTKYHNTI